MIFDKDCLDWINYIFRMIFMVFVQSWLSRDLNHFRFNQKVVEWGCDKRLRTVRLSGQWCYQLSRWWWSLLRWFCQILNVKVRQKVHWNFAKEFWASRRFLTLEVKISNLAGSKKLTKLLSVVISSGKAVVSISVWFWLVDESEWTLNRSANDCNFVGHPSSSSPNKQSDWPSHNQPAGIQPLLPLQWYSFSPQKSEKIKVIKKSFFWNFRPEKSFRHGKNFLWVIWISKTTFSFRVEYILGVFLFFFFDWTDIRDVTIF